MRYFVGVLTLVLVFVIGAGVFAAQRQSGGGSTPVPPPWAYGFTSPPGPPTGAPAAPDAPPPPDEETLHTLAGSASSFTEAQIRNRFGPADWFPGDHPAMPDIVARGAVEREVWACSLCHYPNGKGRPENAGVSGISVDYFVQTMLDFRNERRSSADTRKGNTNRMIAFAKAMTDEEIREAAEYYASMGWTPWIRVVETDVVPKTFTSIGMFLPLEGAEAGMEPIGQRIIETPVKPEDTELLRDPRSGFIAYVPPGSVARGEALASRGQCTLCHGADLGGSGPVPGIAGRSPSYAARQLFDMQQGTRHGVWTELMKPVVENLTAQDILSLAAYTASLAP